MPFHIVFIWALSIPLFYFTVRCALTLASCYRPLPACVADIYTPKIFEIWISFRKKESRFHLICSVANTLLYLTVCKVLFSVPWLVEYRISKLAIILLPAFLCMLMKIIVIPLRYYDEMILKKSYGLCKTSKTDFWINQALQTVLTFLFTVLESGLLFLCFFKNTKDLTVVFSANATVIPLALGGISLAVLLNFVLPVIRGITDRPAPLCDGELKIKLEALSTQLGFRGKIHVAMESDSLNAYYTPIGSQIVLCKGLIKHLSADELCGVVAHEIGHTKHRDILWNLIVSCLLAVVSSYAFWIQINYAFTHPSSELISVIPIRSAYLLLISLFLFVPVSLAIRRLQNRLSEYRADRIAVESGNGENLISALKASASIDFEDLTPHPLLTALYDAHPPLYRRIGKIRAQEQKNTKKEG